jgi:exonuclease III
MFFGYTNQLGTYADAAGNPADGTDDVVLLRIPGESQFASPGTTLLPSQYYTVNAATKYPRQAALFVDVFRRLNDKPDQYTWWSNRGQAWKKNVGWRIDYQIATPGIAASAVKESIFKRRRFSDHAPLTIDYDWPLG